MTPALSILATLVNLHDGIADGGQGITEADWQAARDLIESESALADRFDTRQQFDSPQQAVDKINALGLPYDDRLALFCDTVSENLRFGEGGFAGELAALLEFVKSEP
jgi:hypothetical protein